MMIQIKNNFSLVFIALMLLVSASEAQSFKIENLQQISCDSLKFTKPVWSPDGNSLLLTGENNRGLYIFDIQQQKLESISKDLKIKSKPIWLNNGDIAYLKGKDFGYAMEFKSAGIAPTDTILTIHTRNQKIIAVSLADNKSWEIMPDKALYYNPVISPDSKYAIIHLKSEMYLYATDGSGLMRHIGTGMASSWSADCKYFFYFIDESQDGHSISNSEIYVAAIDSEFKQKITETAGLFEMWPDIAPNGRQLVFVDERSGKIFISDLIITGK